MCDAQTLTPAEARAVHILLEEIDTLRALLDEVNAEADAMAELAAERWQEIVALRAQVDRMRTDHLRTLRPTASQIVALRNITHPTRSKS
jgi:hypothetical protein